MRVTKVTEGEWIVEGDELPSPNPRGRKASCSPYHDGAEFNPTLWTGDFVRFWEEDVDLDQALVDVYVREGYEERYVGVVVPGDMDTWEPDDLEKLLQKVVSDAGHPGKVHDWGWAW